MNYLAIEIDTVLKEQKITHKKLSSEDLKKLISDIKATFFAQAKELDPANMTTPQKEHNPDFWKKADQLQYLESPVLIVHDNQTHAWELKTSNDLKTLLSETTGFPFWITGTTLNFLTYVDDHDCVHLSQPYRNAPNTVKN
jgi:predicted patatin/cPLA2 family phospholipase